MDKKGLVQYKLKVELSPEVMAKVKSLTGEQGSEIRATDVMNTVKGKVADKMLDHRVGREDSKEQPDIPARQKISNSNLEEIKEQASEIDTPNTKQSKPASIQGAVEKPSLTTPSVDPGATIKRRITEAQTKKFSLN